MPIGVATKRCEGGAGSRHATGPHARLMDVLKSGLRALEIAHRQAVEIVDGRDYTGLLHWHHSLALTTRVQMQTPIGVIRSATCNAAGLFQMSGKIGTIAPGAFVVLLVVDGDPPGDISLLQGRGSQTEGDPEGRRILQTRVGARSFRRVIRARACAKEVYQAVFVGEPCSRCIGSVRPAPGRTRHDLRARH